MLTLRGAPSLSHFRKIRLLQQCQDLCPEIVDIFGQFIHFADLTDDLDKKQMSVLEQILIYGPSRDAEQNYDQIVLVLPRPGTISPWSSKATDIAHNCGLTKIKRLERGVSYHFKTVTETALTPTQTALLIAINVCVHLCVRKYNLSLSVPNSKFLDRKHTISRRCC